MVTTSTLMENLRQEGVSPDLLLAVNEYRTTHPLTEALAPRVPQSAFTYYGKDVWEQALAAYPALDLPAQLAYLHLEKPSSIWVLGPDGLAERNALLAEGDWNQNRNHLRIF